MVCATSFVVAAQGSRQQACVSTTTITPPTATIHSVGATLRIVSCSL